MQKWREIWVFKTIFKKFKICSCLIMRINQWIEGGCIQEFKWKAAEMYVKCNSEDEDNDIMKTAGDWGFAEKSRNWKHLKRVWLLRLFISYETSTAIYTQWIALEMSTAKDFGVWCDVPVLFTQGCGIKYIPSECKRECIRLDLANNTEHDSLELMIVASR